ncbi:helix-turn-helix transcriptional regulator [Amycolatopsis rubida]|uniref:Helix-turn-helix transcriptional regulator n=1 Tax=Amycolatopsis rubida TaxID=112413 RepID=A0ABX0BKP2_9PSEU|nr:XRE family transcriptional regulator [Amycolatopsis rubida]MYW95118.1 XRE family transcriptional regulator [Amycolatopsis rubida]NEC55494.1 helix-turn-helix transcriptional regulator [Amycolatopsis rubida]NEC60105.1 helix-turn-helix transcriptional regulator [Amycolatopsis rubida]
MPDGFAEILAARLNKLFATVKPRNGQEYTNDFVAEAITATGVKISGSYIWHLRKARKDNPTLRHLYALAAFFGVPPSYFFDDAVTDRVDEQLQKLQAAQESLTTNTSDAQLIAMRADALSPERRRLVMDLLDVVYRDEQAERGPSPTE